MLPRSHGPKEQPPTRQLPPGIDYVFVQRGGVKKSLSQLYDRPYKVVWLSGAVVTIQLGNKAERVAASRCKAAVVDEPLTAIAAPLQRGQPQQQQTQIMTPAPQATESGRPKRSARLPTCLGIGSTTGGPVW